MAESIHSPNFFLPNAHNSEIRQTFLLYGNRKYLLILAIIQLPIPSVMAYRCDNEATHITCRLIPDPLPTVTHL